MFLTGTNVTAPILPGGTGDRFPSHIDIYGKGGYRSVSGIAQLYNIPENRRSLGMLVYTQDSGRFWALSTGSQNWIELPFGYYKSKINADNILYNLGDQGISGTKHFHGYNTINFEGIWVYDIQGNASRRGAATSMYSGLFSKMSTVDKGLEIIRKAKAYRGAITGFLQLTPEEEDLFRRNRKSGRRYPPDGEIGEGEDEDIITKWIIRTGGRWTLEVLSGLKEEDYEYPPKSEKGEKEIIASPNPPSASDGGGGASDSEEIDGEDEEEFDDSMDGETPDDENFGFPEDESSKYMGAGGRPPWGDRGGDDGGGGGGIGGGGGGGDGGITMLFTNTAPIIVLKDHYKILLRKFKVTEFGGSWNSGLNLMWQPNPNALWPGEKYTASGQSIIGSGTPGAVGNNLRDYRTSGLYSILNPLLWRLNFTGIIDGFLTAYNIDPYTGSRSTFIYPIPKRYHGVSSKESLTGDEITGLLFGEYDFDPRQIRTSSKVFTPNTGYLYFAWPARTGFNNVNFFESYDNSKINGTIHAPKYITGGYRFIVDKRDVHFNQSIVSVKNSVNYTEDYYVYRNRWLLHGSDPIRVSVIGVDESIEKIITY